MWQFFLSGLRVGLRGRSFHAVVIFGVALIVVAYLSGAFSPRQPRTVALDVGFSGVRLTLVLMNLFWVQELFTREIDRRIILFSLTYPVSRAEFVLGRLFAVSALSGLAMLVLGMALVIAVVFSGGEYSQEFPVSLGVSFWITLIGLWLDALVVSAVGIFVASFSTVGIMPLAIGLAFAVAGKALGATLEYLNAGADGDAELLASVGGIIDAIRWLVPDLSRLDWRAWPMYGAVPEWATLGWAALMACSYAAIMALMAIRTLNRREFS